MRGATGPGRLLGASARVAAALGTAAALGLAAAAHPLALLPAAGASGLLLGAPAAVAAVLLHAGALHVGGAWLGAGDAWAAPALAAAVGGLLRNLLLHGRILHPERTGDRVAVATAAVVAALMGPWAWAGAVAGAALLGLRRGRVAFLGFTALSVALSAAAFAVFLPGAGAIHVGPVPAGSEGALRGATGGLRLAAVTGANLAMLSWTPAARLLDGLGLPRRMLAWLGAILLAVQDLAKDAQNLRDARRLDGAWPRAGRIRASAGLLAPLMVAAWRRAQVRRDALRLAGLDTGDLFAPVVAVTALAAVGRLAFAALPNVSPAFVIVFLGGVVFGWRVGALAGLLTMVVTNLVLSGLAPHAFVNAPAMALVGAAGALGRLLGAAASRPGDRAAAVVFAACMGIGATLLFSVVADSLTWLLVQEYQGAGAWRLLVAMGLVFNVLPAAANGVLFAAAVGPVARAFQAVRGLTPQPVQASPGPAAQEA